MNLGFDFDKVFINYPPFIPDLLIDKLYKKKTNGILLYRIPSRPEQLIRIVSHFSIFRPPIQHNIAFVKNLSLQKKYNCYLISSRFGFLKKRTEKIVGKYKLSTSFTGMYFNFDNKQPHIFKDEIIKKLYIERYIDDDYHLIQYLAKKNKKTMFYWLNKKRNESIDKNLFAVTHISQILAI